MPRKSPHFYWQVPEKGFKWVTLPDKHNKKSHSINPAKHSTKHSTKVLCPRQSDDAWRTYYPLKDHTGLFMEFARLETTPQAVLEFANRYGGLEYHNDDVVASHRETAPKALSFADWESEILTIRQLLELWQMASTLDYSNLSNYIRWTAHGIEIRDIYNPMTQDCETSFIISIENSPLLRNRANTDGFIYLPVNEKTFTGFKKSDPSRPVLYFIQHIANYRIKGLVKPQLMLDDHENKMNLKLKPCSFIGALWLQCVMALNDKKIYANCPTCRKWFEVPRNVVNKGKKYCTDACKSRAYRKRKKKVA